MSKRNTPPPIPPRANVAEVREQRAKVRPRYTECTSPGEYGFGAAYADYTAAVDKYNLRKKNRKENRREGFPKLITKQIGIFFVLAIFILFLDFCIFCMITVVESNNQVRPDSPTRVTQEVGETMSIYNQDGTWVCPEDAQELLDEYASWALVLDKDGKTVWEFNRPNDVPTSYTINEIALAGRYAAIGNYTVKFWDMGEGLLIVGFDEDEWWNFSGTWRADTVQRLPLYVTLILFINVAVFLVYFNISRHKIIRATDPITDALDDLATGQPVEVYVGGELKELAQQINKTSSIIEAKDTARANWIRDVSHDIRTPLSLVLGYAEAIAADADTSSTNKENAAAIRNNALKIKDLVNDLNTAAQLNYDVQPLHKETVHVAKLLREIAVSYMNNSYNEPYPLNLAIDDAALSATVQADERLLRRSIENLLSNARQNNPQGCSLTLTLSLQGNRVVIQVQDTGVGVSAEKMSQLYERLEKARISSQSRDWATMANGEEHGLGLVLVDRIISTHGGTFTIQSTEGSGFTATISLPA